jgi:hypothetical protein
MTDTPEPWAPATSATVRLGREENPGDVTSGEPQNLPPSDPVGADLGGRIHEVAGFLCNVSGVTLEEGALVIRQGRTHKRGFVTGRVWYEQGQPRAAIQRLVLTTCPNSDDAEIFTALVHEFAHAVAPERGHHTEFKQACKDLASEVWGWLYFTEVDVAEPSATVDGWIACGIRAAMCGGTRPARRKYAMEQQVSIIRRVLKLRRLAEDVVGTPEGISATAMANGIVTLWGLGDVRADIPEGVGDEMCDRYTFIGHRQKWRRQVAWAVGSFFDLYVLSQAKQGTMHWFGKNSAVEAGIHLFRVAEAHIERRLKDHMEEWDGQGRPNGLHGRSEATNFRYSAAKSFKVKLTGLKAEAAEAAPDEASGAVPDEATEAFEAAVSSTAMMAYNKELAVSFAKGLLESRGVRTTTAKGASWTRNEAGTRAGRTVPMGQGMANSTQSQGLLA